MAACRQGGQLANRRLPVNGGVRVHHGAALVVTVVVLTANMLVDIASSMLDPRQVHERAGG